MKGILSGKNFSVLYNFDMKTIFITGASAGIGKETAKLFLSKGWKVYAAARRLENMLDLKELGAEIIKLDLTDDNSILKAIEFFFSKESQMDVLLNNAGFGAHGMIEDVPVSEGRKQFEVNLFAPARLIQLILPHMREKKSGAIVNMSSIAGKITMPTGGWYHASKHAIEALSDALRIETAQFGIRVILIEPGPVGGTEWDNTALVNLEKYSAKSAYSAMTERITKKFRSTYRQKALKPQTISNVIYNAVSAKHPAARYAVPFATRFAFFLKRVLPDCVFDWVFRYAAEPKKVK